MCTIVLFVSVNKFSFLHNILCVFSFYASIWVWLSPCYRRFKCSFCYAYLFWFLLLIYMLVYFNFSYVEPISFTKFNFPEMLFRCSKIFFRSWWISSGSVKTWRTLMVCVWYLKSSEELVSTFCFFNLYILHAMPFGSLTCIFSIAVLLNSPQIFEKIFGDDYIMDVIGCLECKLHMFLSSFQLNEVLS